MGLGYPDRQRKSRVEAIFEELVKKISKIDERYRPMDSKGCKNSNL